MKNFVTALASALLVAVIVTCLHYYVFSNDLDRAPLALFVLSFLGMAGVALFNVRQSALRSGLAPAAAVAATAPRGGRGETNNSGSKSGNANRNGKSGRGQRDRKDARGADRAPRGGDQGGGTSSKEAAAPTKPATPVPDGPRETGTVKWFNRSKGFGFIVRENGEEIFVHHRSIRNSDDSRRSNLRDGQSVNYVVADHSKGQQAEDVVGE